MIKKLEPGEYGDYLCREIGRVLLRLKELHGLRVSEVYLDVKAVSVDCYLDGPLPEGAVSRLRGECSDLPGVRFAKGWIACAEYYCSIRTARRGEAGVVAGKPRSLWDRLRRLIAG